MYSTSYFNAVPTKLASNRCISDNNRITMSKFASQLADMIMLKLCK